MLNDVESVLLSAEELAKRIEEIGAEISADYAGKEILMIGVLRGAVLFMADLASVLCHVRHRNHWLSKLSVGIHL